MGWNWIRIQRSMKTGSVKNIKNVKNICCSDLYRLFPIKRSSVVARASVITVSWALSLLGSCTFYTFWRPLDRIRAKYYLNHLLLRASPNKIFLRHTLPCQWDVWGRGWEQPVEPDCMSSCQTKTKVLINNCDFIFLKNFKNNFTVFEIANLRLPRNPCWKCNFPMTPHIHVLIILS